MRTSARTGPSGRRGIFAALAVLSAAALAVVGVQAPVQAAEPALTAPAAAPSDRVAFEAACDTPKKGDATCFALRRTDVTSKRGVRPALDAPDGFGAADLRSAYKLPADGGAGQTIAIVDAYDDPNAEADLAVYRQQYGLPACTTANGCFTKLSQRGGTDYPRPDADWSGEISLDLDMVSAIAPLAHILLIEADDPSFENLGAAVEQAVAQGAKFVSNSYGSDYRGGNGEDPVDTTTLNAFYNHPGVAITVSSGDYAYGVSFPAASPYVTSVGGTSLFRDTGAARGWSESAWDGAGSGCSRYQPKPAFQSDTGCANRSVSDVSAVSDTSTPVAVYQTYGNDGWAQYGGTSVAAPIIAGVYAVAGTPVPGTYPNTYPYDAAGQGINDVTGGSNGTCAPAYLCSGVSGYDGPTGLGTPDGLTAFQSRPHGKLSGTVTDSVTGKPVPSATVTVGRSVTHSAADGSYSLSVPVGSYDVTVDSFGYATGTATALAIADGDALTKNFALVRVPAQTVSGRVTDGSGHGWPLYAKITVDDVPGGPVWTDPATGAYELTLPQGHDYTLHVAASTAGYQELTRTVTLAAAPATANLALAADPWAATAPGYTVHDTGTTEPFDSTASAPQGWSVVNAPGTTPGWDFDDPIQRGNGTGGQGAFAVADSAFYGDAPMDTELRSPAYDFTGQVNPEVAFSTEYLSSGGQSASVDASTDDGATWKSVWSTIAEVSGHSRIEIPLTDYAGTPDVRLRFHFIGTWGWFWEVDDVFVGQRSLTATPGGFVTGNVTDANTGDGLVGAAVTSKDSPVLTTKSVATPEDPDLGDGFYSLFTPDLGAHSFTASKAPYTALSKSAKVPADGVASASFKLKAGQLAVTPGSFAKTVGWGKQATQKLTVKNTGGEPATLKVGEQTGAFQPQARAGAPLQRIKGTYSPLASKATAGKVPASKVPASKVPAGTAPHGATAATQSAAPSDSAWQTVPSLPHPVIGNAAGAYGGKIYSGFGFSEGGNTSALYALDPAVGSWTELAAGSDPREAPAYGFIDGKFYVSGGWDSDGNADSRTEIYDPAKNIWTTGAPAPKPHAGSGSAVLDGKLYMIGGCLDFGCGSTDAGVYDPVSDSWSQISPYPEPVAWESCGGIAGKLYCAGGDSYDTGETKHAYVYDPDTNGWSRVADLPASIWGSVYASANGQLVISSGISENALTNAGYAFDPKSGAWSSLPNANVATYRGSGALGFYKLGGGTTPGAPGTSAELLPGYEQPDGVDISWLSENTRELTLQPGASSTITVILDSAVPEITQPGDYRTQLLFRTDTPYQVPRLPVTLHVDPPKTWGKITGIVRGATTSGGTTPLAGATVQISGWAASYSLRTDSDGTYTLWLDARNNPLTVIAAKDGYQPTVTTLKITKGSTVTTDFTLKRQ